MFSIKGGKALNVTAEPKHKSLSLFTHPHAGILSLAQRRLFTWFHAITTNVNSFQAIIRMKKDHKYHESGHYNLSSTSSKVASCEKQTKSMSRFT